MKKNEGFVERLIQISISSVALAIAISGLSGTWRYVLVGFSLLVLFFSSVSFCPAYAILGIKKDVSEKISLRKIFIMIILFGIVFISASLIIKLK